jgi:sugar transferase EpsL
MNRAPRRIKRPFDLIVGGILLVVALPVMLLVALVVRWNLGSPVLFRQTRPGLDGRPFDLLKFRTMKNAAEPVHCARPDGERLTRVGRWLRGTSLDELPELVNVVRGEMSLVGPRPLLMQYLERYTPRQARRHEVRPGITGLAQVSGRNRLSWEERFELDVWYVDHWSFALDLRILLRTAARVLIADGINQPGHDTATEFLGSHHRAAPRTPDA